ncbi:MAG: hypothetical protein AAB262_04435 [Elusimicrobiota bacterium]
METAVQAGYRPRDAAASPLYSAVLDHLETYLATRSRAKNDPAHPAAEDSLAGKVVREAKRAAKTAGKGWAACLRKIFEVDPVLCVKCGGEMKLVAVIADDGERRASEATRAARRTRRARIGRGGRTLAATGPRERAGRAMPGRRDF